jgi:hypothetical protein
VGQGIAEQFRVEEVVRCLKAFVFRGRDRFAHICFYRTIENKKTGQGYGPQHEDDLATGLRVRGRRGGAHERRAQGFYRACELRMDTLVTHPIFGYRVSCRQLLELQVRGLAKVLGGDIARYPVFVPGRRERRGDAE